MNLRSGRLHLRRIFHYEIAHTSRRDVEELKNHLGYLIAYAKNDNAGVIRTQF